MWGLKKDLAGLEGEWRTRGGGGGGGEWIETCGGDGSEKGLATEIEKKTKIEDQ